MRETHEREEEEEERESLRVDFERIGCWVLGVKRDGTEAKQLSAIDNALVADGMVIERESEEREREREREDKERERRGWSLGVT